MAILGLIRHVYRTRNETRLPNSDAAVPQGTNGLTVNPVQLSSAWLTINQLKLDVLPN